MLLTDLLRLPGWLRCLAFRLARTHDGVRDWLPGWCGCPTTIPSEPIPSEPEEATA